MKKLGKLTISPEKILKNDELINLNGGYGGMGYCGEGFASYYCNYSACSGCGQSGWGTVCVISGWSYDGCDVLRNMYPDMSSCDCRQIY